MPRSRRNTGSSRKLRRGAADYMTMEGEFAKYLEDVYSADPVPREALTDECDILVVGAGFAGLLLWHKLQDEGFIDVRFCEKGGDVGGTWYWNRYPGIACDVESYSYFPLLEEMGYVPTMKFASGFEILEYCQSMAEKFGFYDHCLFHTTVEKTEWDEGSGRWTVYTDRGDADARSLRDPRQRHPHQPEARSHRRHGDLQGRGVPHLPLELQRRAGRQAGRHHRHRCDRRAGRFPNWRRSSRSSTCSSARRRPSTCAISGRRRRKRSRHGRTSQVGPGPGGLGSPRSRRAVRRSRRTTTTSPARSPTSRSARSTSGGCRPRNWSRSSSTRTSGSWSRSARASMRSSRTRRRRRR